MLSRTVLTIVVLGSLVLAIGCGGGTIGTGINSLGRPSSGSTTMHVVLVARVVDAKGKHQQNAVITLHTASGTVSRATASSGTATLPLSLESGELVRFEVRTGTRVFRTEEYLSPAGSSRISRTLRLTATGQIEVLED